MRTLAPKNSHRRIHLCSSDYIQNRSTNDAIGRVMEHCRQVQQLHNDMIQTVHTRRLQVSTPVRWRDCSLALLSKPNKPCRRPENLRPLNIQDVSGKCFARCLKDMLFSQGRGRILQYPQFAYIQNRSTNDAIGSVMEHCRQVQQLHNDMIQTVHTRRLQVSTPGIAGGCQLALDMSTACDRVPRWALAEALKLAGADDKLVAVILDLRNGCSYHIRHGPHTGQVRMGRGVRQGCTLALRLEVPMGDRLSYLGVVATYGAFEDQSLSHRIRMQAPLGND